VRGLFGWFAIAFASAGILHSNSTPAARVHASVIQTNQDPTQTLAVRAFLDTYCASCHGNARPIAGVALDALDVADVGRHAHVWERVVRQLRAGLMPPGGYLQRLSPAVIGSSPRSKQRSTR
jgi:mono/diheme cytochrome c family protein